MTLSQKCQYAVRSMLELARLYDQGPVRIGIIAERQAIPQRFLENILNELKSTGLVESRRGARGGYLLTKKPEEITVGDIIRLVDGPLEPVRCIGDSKGAPCPLQGQCSLSQLWNKAKRAVEDVYDGVTLKDIVDQDENISKQNINYYI